MKKIILSVSVVLVIILGAATLVGCTSVSAQKALNSMWDAKETATYDVVRYSSVKTGDDADRKELSKGVMTITTERKNNDTISVGGNTIDKFTGTIVTARTEMDDTSYMDTAVAFNAKFVPVASYKKSFVIGYDGQNPSVNTLSTITAQYKNNKYEYKANEKQEGKDEIVKEDTITLAGKSWDKTPYTDDLMLYHIARASFSGKDKAFQSISMVAPSWSENTTKVVAFSLVSKGIDMKIMGADAKVSKVQVQRAQTFPGKGTPNYVYFNDEPLKLEGDGHASTAGTRVIIKIEEREMEYTIKSFQSFSA